MAAIAVCDMLSHNPDKSMADLYRDLPKTWQSPTMSPHCDDEKKYGVVDRVIAHFKGLAESGGELAGPAIRDVITVNGIRIMLEDGTWGLVRASSNKPELVVVVESPVSEANMRAIFAEIDAHLATYPEIGAYNQKIESHPACVIPNPAVLLHQVPPHSVSLPKGREDAWTGLRG